MRGRSAHKLIATMGGGHIDTLVCEPFKTATVHVFHTGTNATYPYVYDLGGCGAAELYPSTAQASNIPAIFPYIASGIGGSKIGAVYGSSAENIINRHNPDKVKQITGAYFQSSDLNAWSFRRTTPPISMLPPGDPNAHPAEVADPHDYPTYVTGPGVSNPHAFYPIKRRTPCDPPYSGYLNWCFTDQGTSHMLDGIDGDPICCADPLGFSYPAKHIWRNADVDQPFAAMDWWEDSGTDPITVATEEGRGIIPFCTPMPAYDAAGVLLGNYVGYCHMVFFNNNFYVGANDQGAGTAADPGNLPTDFTSIQNPQPPVKRYKDAHSLDVHVYMVASPAPGKTLKSPRIGSKRFWRPNNVLGYPWAPNGEGPGVPYIYFICGSNRYDWGIRLKLNLVGGGTVEKVMGMGNMTAYLVP
jgi:hypothetical protein